MVLDSALFSRWFVLFPPSPPVFYIFDLVSIRERILAGDWW
jgi:hypothetical protein